ncbi:unnamed protein product [Amoebophrya sp. A120]|nr:unnamed protein product [Amoebophrya sp. A120]|eukprot:GSA120T00010101001.1
MADTPAADGATASTQQQQQENTSRGLLQADSSGGAPQTEGVDPRGFLMKCCFPVCTIWAWQGCDDCFPILCTCVLDCFFLGCLFPLFCWKPGPQKIWKADPEQERKVCFWACHPLSWPCKLLCCFVSVYAWQGFDVWYDLFFALDLECFYTLCCWVPRKQQKIWGAGSTVVGAPIMGNYGTV